MIKLFRFSCLFSLLTIGPILYLDSKAKGSNSFDFIPTILVVHFPILIP
jgi:hypothetical protein